jgi:hypothetical protein
MGLEKEMQSYRVHSTSEYYGRADASLGWELTVCNALYPESSPCRRFLKKNASYGVLLFDFLQSFLPFHRIKQVIEIGGGYGYLMKDLLARKPHLTVTMLDISPFLLNKQKKHLKNDTIQYQERDFLNYEPGLLRGQELAILNENMGDFPTITHINREIFQTSPGLLEPALEQVRVFFDQYDFIKPESDLFHFNLGALQAVQKLCSAGVPYVFVSEHSCEALVPAAFADFIHIHSAGQPEKISLHGHAEYSIQFSYLEKMARCFQYQVVRGPLADFIKMDFSASLRALLRLPSTVNDEAEIIRHFVEDLFKYEYLLLLKEPAGSTEE